MNTALLSLIIFAIFVIVCIWDKLPMATTAIMACAAMVIFGVADFGTSFGQFASANLFLLMGVMVVGASMTETGVSQAIGNIVTRFSGNSERRILAVAYIISYLLSAFMSTSSVLAMFMAILFGMNTRDGKINHRNLIMPILISSILGGISTLVGSTQQVFANGLIEPLGVQMGVFDFTPVGLILGVAGFVYTIFIGYPLGKKIWGKREPAEGCEIAAAQEMVIDKRKFYTMIGILVFMVASFIVNYFAPAITAGIAALLCIVTGCITQKKAISQINWNVLGRLGGVLSLSKVLTASGGVDLLSGWVQNVLGSNLSPYLLFAVCVLAAQLLSMFLFNSTAIMLVLSFVISLVEPMGLNPIAYAMGITLGASIVFSSPLAGTSNQMTMAAGYRFKDFVRYGGIFDAIGYLIIIIFVPIFFPLVV